jgi:hypothetical protein
MVKSALANMGFTMPAGGRREDAGAGDGLGRRLWFVLPSPFLLELFEDECDAPSCLFVDFLEDLKHFLLLASVGQALSCMGQGADSYTSDSPVDSISIKIGLMPVTKLLTCP